LILWGRPQEGQSARFFSNQPPKSEKRLWPDDKPLIFFMENKQKMNGTIVTKVENK